MQFKSLRALLIAAGILGVGACSEVDDIIDVGDSIREPGEISGDITADETWSKGNDYILAGRVTVKDGVTLTIEPGTIIKAKKEPLGWLQIERGAKIMAEGTAIEPIVFTSNQPVGSRQRGDWGGVVLLGKAPNNIGSDVELEGDGGTHGGSETSDNSGVLKYVRIEYAGWEPSPDNELNGLTLGSVGNGTTLDYIQVHYGQDDGIEFFGGTASAKHLVVSGTGDDCVDTDQGYTGAMQYVVCMQDLGEGDNGIEASNQGDNLDATPRAFPRIANYTFIGRGEYSTGKGNGLKFKEGTQALMTNGVVMNFVESGADIDDASDADAGNSDGTAVDIRSTVFFANRVTALSDAVDGFTQFTDDEDAVDEPTFVTAATRGNILADPALKSTAFQNPNLLPSSGSVALDCDAPPAPFESSAFCGAFGSENWMDGWTLFSDVEASSVETISGFVSENTTWTSDRTYVLSGRVSVEPGVTLTIEPGTTIVGLKEPLGWLQVQRGAKIQAVGTASDPIVFTSAQKDGEKAAGDWGGVVVLGAAPNNVDANNELEGNGGTHGGTNAADDSGTIAYVRIEYAGWELSPDNELNGLTLGSVGSGTDVHHVQVHMGLDDGVEWFGGRVNAHHLIVSAVADDCFDTDQGYIGYLQFLVCMQGDAETADNGLEASNQGDNFDATPRSMPHIANFTFVGNGGFAKGDGLRNKENGALDAFNGVVIGFKNALDIDDATNANGSNSDASQVNIHDSYFFGNKAAGANTGDANLSNDDGDAVDEQAYIADPARSNMFVDPELTNPVLGDSLNLRPASGSPVLTGCQAPGTGFAETAVTYCGAFDATNDWTLGWTSFE